MNEEKIILGRLHSAIDSGTYFWVFVQFQGEVKFEFLGHEKFWIYICRESLITGYPPCGGYLYKNPHERHKTRKE